MAANSGVLTQDLALEHKLGRLRLNPLMMNGVTITDGTPPVLTALGNGTPVVAAELAAALEITGIPLDDGDEIYYLVDVKSDLHLADLSRDLWLELLFTSSKATAHASIDFKAFAKGFALGEVYSDVLSTPDASVVFPAQSVSATNLLVSAMMPLGAAGTFADDENLGIVIELDDKGDGAADETHLMIARLVYTREICHPTGEKQWT